MADSALVLMHLTTPPASSAWKGPAALGWLQTSE
jgi:hypothetical protein